VYVDTSAVLRALIDAGRSPDVEHALAAASGVITSRLTLVEAARALLRLRHMGEHSAERIAEARLDLDSLWARCDIWELSPLVCDTATTVAANRPLRALDALHLATYVLARQRFPDIELLTADRRLSEAAVMV
jgi:predicted nucleic acid-binding protein